MKKFLFSAFFSTLLWGAAADTVDHSAEFEAARLQKATFENRGADPITFDVLSHYVDFVATGTTKVVTPLPGHTFQGTDAPRIGIKNYNINSTVTVPLKRTITLLPGERRNYEVPFPHYVGGVTGGTLRTVAWAASEALDVVMNSGVNEAPASRAFVTTPKDVAQQLRYYKKYFMGDGNYIEAEIIADFLSQGSGVTSAKRAEEVIISLTSYPARFATTWLAIESLLRQSERPDRIILNLFEGEFPGRVLPWFIREQMKRGLEINWCPENLKVCLNLAPTEDQNPVELAKLYYETAIYGGQIMQIDFPILSQYLCQFNPSIINVPEGYLIALRVSNRCTIGLEYPFRRDIILGLLLDSKYQLLRTFPIVDTSLFADHSFEDPRLFWNKNELYISFVDCTTDYWSWSHGNRSFEKSHVYLAKLDDSYRISSWVRPDIGKNLTYDKWEKNWCYFEHNGHLFMLYDINTLYKVESPLSRNQAILHKRINTIQWDYGEIHNSLHPFFLPELNTFLLFFHSFIRDSQGRRYFLGLAIMDEEFNIKKFSNKPLLSGKTPFKSLGEHVECILPFGITRQDSEILLSVGVNDFSSWLINFKIQKLLDFMSQFQSL